MGTINLFAGGTPNKAFRIIPEGTKFRVVSVIDTTRESADYLTDGRRDHGLFSHDEVSDLIERERLTLWSGQRVFDLVEDWQEIPALADRWKQETVSKFTNSHTHFSEYEQHPYLMLTNEHGVVFGIETAPSFGPPQQKILPPSWHDALKRGARVEPLSDEGFRRIRRKIEEWLRKQPHEVMRVVNEGSLMIPRHCL